MKKFFRSLLTTALVLALCAPALGGDTLPTSRVGNEVFGTRVALGLVEGWEAVRKFADREGIDPGDNRVDVWDYQGVLTYTYSPDGVADIDTISSSDTDDDQTMILFGLDAAGDPLQQVAVLDGQNKVPITPMWRIYRVVNFDSTDLEGEIYVYVDTAILVGVPTDKTKIRAYVNDGNNQTLMSPYTVPKGKVACVTDFTAAISRGTAATSAVIEARVRLYGKVFATQLRVAINTTGTSQYIESPQQPLCFPELSDFLASATVGQNGTGISVIYSLTLVDNEKQNTF